MRLDEAEQMAHALIRHHGLHDYQFQWMQNRKKFNTAGYCSWKKKVISLQPRFVVCNYPVLVKRTLLHEIAHALAPKQGHNRHWKAMAIKIGHSGSRCYGKEVRKRKSRHVTAASSMVGNVNS